jgi:hypothetical protein
MGVWVNRHAASVDLRDIWEEGQAGGLSLKPYEVSVAVCKNRSERLVGEDRMQGIGYSGPL